MNRVAEKGKLDCAAQADGPAANHQRAGGQPLALLGVLRACEAVLEMLEE